MADELIAALTGAYGHPVVQTPHLDALVRQGVRFDAAYSPAPLCAPARACLISGQYTSTNRVYDNAALFAADIPSMGHYLTNAGYDCVLSGKMHFVGPDQLHGFRRRLTTDIYAEEFSMLDNRAPWSVARDPAQFDPERGRGRHARQLRRLQRPRRALAPPPLLRRGGPLPGPGVPPRSGRPERDGGAPLGTARSAGEPGRAPGSGGALGRAGARLGRGGRPALVPLRLVPPPARALLAPAGRVGPLRGGRDRGAPVPGEPGRALLGHGPLAQRQPRRALLQGGAALPGEPATACAGPTTP